MDRKQESVKKKWSLRPEGRVRREQHAQWDRDRARKSALREARSRLSLADTYEKLSCRIAAVLETLSSSHFSDHSVVEALLLVQDGLSANVDDVIVRDTADALVFDAATGGIFPLLCGIINGTVASSRARCEAIRTIGELHFAASPMFSALMGISFFEDMCQLAITTSEDSVGETVCEVLSWLCGREENRLSLVSAQSCVELLCGVPEDFSGPLVRKICRTPIAGLDSIISICIPPLLHSPSGDSRYNGLCALVALADDSKYWGQIQAILDPPLVLHLANSCIDVGVAVQTMELLCFFPDDAHSMAPSLVPLLDENLCGSHSPRRLQESVLCLLAKSPLIVVENSKFWEALATILQPNHSSLTMCRLVLDILIWVCNRGFEGEVSKFAAENSLAVSELQQSSVESIQDRVEILMQYIELPVPFES